MSNLTSFNINGIDASINLASKTENGLMSSESYIQLNDITNGNLFAGLSLTNKFLTSNGMVSSDSAYQGYVTDYISVTPGDKLFVRVSAPAINVSLWGIVWAYPNKSIDGAINLMPNINQNYIRIGSYNITSTVLEVPEGCYYIRACSRIMDDENTYLPTLVLKSDIRYNDYLNNKVIHEYIEDTIEESVQDTYEQAVSYTDFQINVLTTKQILNVDRQLFYINLCENPIAGTEIRRKVISSSSVEYYSISSSTNAWSVSEPIIATGIIKINFSLEFISSGSYISFLYSNGSTYQKGISTSIDNLYEDGDYEYTLDFDKILSNWEDNYIDGVYIWVSTGKVLDTSVPLDVIVSNFKVYQDTQKYSYNNISGTTVYELFDSIDEKLENSLASIHNGYINTLATTANIDPYSAYIYNYDIVSNSFVFSYISSTGNNWANFYSGIYPTGNGTIYITGKVTFLTTTGSIVLIISDGKTVNDHYTTVGNITESGEFKYKVDTAYLVAHSSFDGSLGFNIWINNNGTVTALIEGFTVYEMLEEADTALIDGSTAKELFESVDTQLNVISNEIDSIGQIRLISPSGNNYFLSVQDDGSVYPIPIIPNKAAFFGNSLIAGFGSYGMAASDSTHDYYYLITEYIKTLNPAFTSNKTGASAFEGLTTTDETTILSNIQTTFFNILDGTEDLIIIQLGDNVNTTDKNTAFATNCAVLLKSIREYCPKARVVWIGMWYASTARYNVIREACNVTGCEYVFFNGLNTSDAQNVIGGTYYYDTASDRTLSGVSDIIENTSTNITFTLTVNSTAYSVTMDVNSYSLSDTTLSYNGNYAVITSSGVASHPGNEGFRRIANKVLYQLGISDSEETYAAE